MTPKEQELAYKTLLKLGKSINDLRDARLFTSEHEYALKNMADCINTLETLLRPDRFNEPLMRVAAHTREPKKKSKKKWGLF